MLYDRCMLTKKNDEWFGLVELRQRVNERWRFAAWLMLIIIVIECFRWVNAGLWYFSAIEYGILALSIFFFIAFYRKSSKTFKYRETVFRVSAPHPIRDEVGQILGYKKYIYLPENAEFKKYEIDDFSHVVFGLIDYPWPGRKNVNIEAFALYLAEKDGTPHPIVEGCFDKYSCFTLARRIAALTGLPLIELGKGQPFVKADSKTKA